MMRGAWNRRLLGGAVLALVTACGQPRVREEVPRAEFLLSAGDSTYWVRTGANGLSVRSSPLLLTHDGARFHEIYVSDEDRVWPDAVFIAQRLWRRDLVTGDSIELARDSTVMALAARYAARHRDVAPLEPDEPLPEEPSINAGSEFEVIDVHGPFVSWLRHIDVESADAREHRHEVLWRVSDIRDGRVASVGDLFGAGVGDSLVARAHRSFRLTRDSLAHAAATRGVAAQRALAALTFDSLGFSLADQNGAPRVLPMSATHDSAGRPVTLALPALDVAPSPTWWTTARALLPRVSRDSAELRWERPGYEIVARFDASRDRLRLALRSRARNAPELVIGSVPGPAWSMIPLEGSAVDSASRTALARAFHESQEYGDGTQQIAARPGGATLLQPVARATRR
ncbi:MAG: hypothetical protein MUF00_08090 [Gemmatimonadaceae bacterium]|jgi:hypothetical protein|nr:hypothetical protein [Gemmatimonadaceae bacterium]